MKANYFNFLIINFWFLAPSLFRSFFCLKGARRITILKSEKFQLTVRLHGNVKQGREHPQKVRKIHHYSSTCFLSKFHSWKRVFLTSLKTQLSSKENKCFLKNSTRRSFWNFHIDHRQIAFNTSSPFLWLLLSSHPLRSFCNPQKQRFVSPPFIKSTIAEHPDHISSSTHGYKTNIRTGYTYSIRALFTYIVHETGLCFYC